MTEQIKLWLEALYREELEAVENTLDNETLWLLGSTGKNAERHSKNIKTLHEYATILTELIEAL